MIDNKRDEPRIIEHQQEAYRPPVGPSMAPDAWQLERDAHYEKMLGKPAFVWHVDTALLPHIDVYLYEPSTERNYYTLLTSGMSDARMSVPKEVSGVAARAEIIQYVAHVDVGTAKVEPPWFVQSMFSLARFPFAYRTWLSYAHTVPNGEPAVPFTQGSLLTTAFFMEPVFEPTAFRRELTIGDEPVDLLWLGFITEAELQFKLQYGQAALLAAFRERHYPQLLDVYRTSLV